MPLTNRYLVVEVSTYIFWKVNLLFLNSTGMKNQVSLEGECYFLTFSRSASLFWMKDHTFFDFFSSKLVYLLFWLLMALAETPSSKFDVPFRFRFLWNPIKNAVLWLFNNHIILMYVPFLHPYVSMSPFIAKWERKKIPAKNINKNWLVQFHNPY